MITMIIYGNPVPKARARTVRLKTGKTVSFTPMQTEKWKDSVRAQAIAQRPDKLLDGPLKFEAIFYLMRPPSRPKREMYPDRKPDLDNLVKSIKDALEGIVYTNDSRIVEEKSCKVYGDPPRVEIAIRAMVSG